jgi:hypothetical protein
VQCWTTRTWAAPLTALGVALGLERLLGLDSGAPAAAGRYLPEVLLTPAAMIEQLHAFEVSTGEAQDCQRV